MKFRSCFQGVEICELTAKQSARASFDPERHGMARDGRGGGGPRREFFSTRFSVRLAPYPSPRKFLFNSPGTLSRYLAAISPLSRSTLSRHLISPSPAPPGGSSFQLARHLISPSPHLLLIFFASSLLTLPQIPFLLARAAASPKL